MLGHIIPFSNSQRGRLHLLRNVAIGKTKRIPKPILNNHHLMLSRNQSSTSGHKDTVQPWNQEVVPVTWQTVLSFSRWNPPTTRKKGMTDQYPRKNPRNSVQDYNICKLPCDCCIVCLLPLAWYGFYDTSKAACPKYHLMIPEVLNEPQSFLSNRESEWW